MSTLLGIVLGLGLIGGAIWLGGGVMIFFNLQALLIVLGGTLAATLISFGGPVVLNLFRTLIRLFRDEPFLDLEATLTRLVTLGYLAERKSVYALEGEIAKERNPYIKTGLSLLVKDADAHRLGQRFAIELEGVRARHQLGIRVFSVMAKLAPSFGLVGTLIGLINMLRGIRGDIAPETLGPGMAVAMVTTLYGALLAFLFFLPAAEKLKAASSLESRQITLVRDGMLLLREGCGARELEQSLHAYLPRGRRLSVVDRLQREPNTPARPQGKV